MSGKFSLSLAPAAVLLASMFAGAPATATIVTNGGFETGDFTGWNLTSNAVLDGAAQNAFVLDEPPVPQSGTYGASFGFVGAAGGLGQSIVTTTGTTYTIDFWLQAEADPLGASSPNSFQFLWNGSIVTNLLNDAPFAYQHFSYDLTATSAVTQIDFLFRNDPAFWDLDNVAVNATVLTPVPEPGSWALMGVGLAALAFQRRRAATVGRLPR